MLPAAKKATRKAAASTSTAAPADAERLVASCGRAALEQLVLSSLRAGAPISLKQLEGSARPPPARAAVRVGTAVAQFEDAGPFSLLPVDLLVKVLENCYLPVKLTFTIEVCKGLRPLRFVADLWSVVRTSLQDAQRLGHHYETVDWITSRNLVRFAQWLPDADKVTELSLLISKGFAPDDVSATLALFPGVERLSLTGQGMNKKILTLMAKVQRPALRILDLDWGQVGAATVLAVLKTAPSLESLASHKLSGDILEGLAKLLREARQGGTPLLTRLRQTGRYAENVTPFAGVAAGALFPELQEFTISFALRGPSPPLPTAPLQGANLRRLHIYDMIYGFTASDASPHLSDASLACFIKTFVSGCPRLESLCLAHGRKYLSRGETLPRLPRLGKSFQATPLPRTLVMLELKEIVVAPSDFAGCELPALALVRLKHCKDEHGPDLQKDTIEELCMACPKLEPSGCVADEHRFEPKHSSKLQQARVCNYPAEHIGGLSLEGVLDALERGYTLY